MNSSVPQEVPKLRVTPAPLTQVAALLGELGAIDIALEHLFFRRQAIEMELLRLAEGPQPILEGT